MTASNISDSPYPADIIAKAGILFMSIQWLQSRMAWLLTLKEVSDRDKVSVADLWYCPKHWSKWQSCRDRHGQNFSKIAQDFAETFSNAMENEDTVNLNCLVCMRNMLAHSVLSAYQRRQESGAEDVPYLVHMPRRKVSKACRKCPDYPNMEDSPVGVTIPLGPSDLEGCIARLKTQQEVIKRVAASLNLDYIDLY